MTAVWLKPPWPSGRQPTPSAAASSRTVSSSRVEQHPMAQIQPVPVGIES